MLSSANALAMRTSLNPAFWKYGAAMKFQCPGGVGELRPSDHLKAMASSSRDRLFDGPLHLGEFLRHQG